MKITTLEERKKRGDAIQFFKFNEGYNKAVWHHPNALTNSLKTTGPAGSIRGKKDRLARQYTKNCDQRDNFFTNRVVPIWNALPEHVIKAKSINEFKNRYDQLKKKKISQLAYSKPMKPMNENTSTATIELLSAVSTLRRKNPAVAEQLLLLLNINNVLCPFLFNL